MRVTLPDHTELARRLCYWHRTHKNDQARQAMQPRVTTHHGNAIEAFLVLSGVEPTGDAVARHAIILDWATSPLPK